MHIRKAGRPGIPRHIRDRSNPKEVCGDSEFRARFRLYKATVVDIVDELTRMLGSEDPQGPFTQNWWSVHFCCGQLTVAFFGLLRTLWRSTGPPWHERGQGEQGLGGHRTPPFAHAWICRVSKGHTLGIFQGCLVSKDHHHINIAIVWALLPLLHGPIHPCFPEQRCSVRNCKVVKKYPNYLILDGRIRWTNSCSKRKLPYAITKSQHAVGTWSTTTEKW